MTRTVKFGTPNAKAQEIYDVVLKAETEAIAAIKPGVTISDVDHIAETLSLKRVTVNTSHIASAMV